MSLIPYPNQITPDRQTSMLERSDELFRSPATGIQQVTTRGHAYWRHTIEYKDLSDSERDIVQAFLMKCKGSINTFRLPDFGNYGVAGSASDWLDIFGGKGYLKNQADLNYFSHTTVMTKTLLNGGGVVAEYRSLASTFNMYKSNVWTVTAGHAQLIRAKVFNKDPMTIRFNAGSNYDIMLSQQVNSSSQISAPFFTDIGSMSVAGLYTQYTTATNRIGDQFRMHDLVLSRAALVSNSENLVTYSNEFDHADWNALVNASVASGYHTSPTGVTSGGWRWFTDTSVNTFHYILHGITKTMTEDIYTVSIFAKAAAADKNIRLRLDDGGTTDGVSADFYLNSGTVTAITEYGTYTRGRAKIFDVGSSWYRCQLTCVVNSENQVRPVIYMTSGSSVVFTGNGSDGVEIFGAQLRKHPFAGHYVPTTDTIVVGSGWQTGSRLYVEGLDASTIIARAGTRFELINRYHDTANNLYERSEFKRLTADLKSHREGWGVLEFDPPIRNAPEPLLVAKNAATNFLGETMHNAVIFNNPEMTCRLVNNTIQYIEKPLKLTDIVFDVIEDLTV